MMKSRRSFLKVSGACLLGLGVKPVLDAFAQAEQAQILPGPNALKAGRWAMVVDIMKCPEGCHDCINACHSAHNVPDFGKTKEEVKWLWNESYEHVFPGVEHEYVGERIKQQPFLVLCNHCDNPPCVRVCPVQATWKREDGIVMMDFHRCIGCRCCMAACPYGSRSFNWSDPRPHIPGGTTNPDFPTRTKGVVEKCNFCVERLAKGLQPACVEVCSHGVLTFGDLDDPNSEVRRILGEQYSIQRRPELGTRPRVYYIM
jgi:molybdopterin-containing oxidoreductase family iron-sulfur binding subunit